MKSFLFALGLVALSAVQAAEPLRAQPVTAKIDLIDELRRGEVEYHLNPGNEFPDEPGKVWLIEGSVLHITGRASGYAATKKSYRDYRMIAEYRWGERTWGKREHAARDNGFFLHAHGPHGALGGSWMASLEAQIIEGGTGDLLVLSPKEGPASSVMSAFRLDRDGEKVWTAGAPLQPVKRGRINWAHRDEDWADKKGVRGLRDLENPVGEWNRFEAVAAGNRLQYLVNGTLVNEATEVSPAEGRILTTCLGAEILVRRWELWPLGSEEGR